MKHEPVTHTNALRETWAFVRSMSPAEWLVFAIMMAVLIPLSFVLP